MKKFEKIEKMTSSPDELKATEKDITKYENKVQIYIRYIATQNQAEIERRMTVLPMSRPKSSPAEVAVIEGIRQGQGSPSKLVQQKQKQQPEKLKSSEKAPISVRQIISPVKPSSPVKGKIQVKQLSPVKVPSPSKINPELSKISLISP